MTKQAVATFNTGSSSIKFSLYDVSEGGLGPCVLRGAVNDLKTGPNLSLSIGSDAAQRAMADQFARCEQIPVQQIATLAQSLNETAEGANIIGIGHRIVHGGQTRNGPQRATPALLDELEKWSVFAPSHQPHNLAGVRAIWSLWPDLPQTLSFDTAFHISQSDVARMYGIPRTLTEQGLIRYGFHGLSFQHVANIAPQLFETRPANRVIVAHLGSGASLCAIKGGKSIATSMGLTALDGLLMSTRCGSIDPGLILHLTSDRNMPPEAVSELLYKQSGLLGVSGISGDMRDLLENPAPQAKQAVELFIHRIVCEAGAQIAALGGLDAIVFTGGIGENLPEIRQRVCGALGWLGVKLDAAANASGAEIISAPASEVSVGVVRADEEYVIAGEALQVLGTAAA